MKNFFPILLFPGLALILGACGFIDEDTIAEKWYAQHCPDENNPDCLNRSGGWAPSSCAPENGSNFCARLGKNCGRVMADDNCGVLRFVNCGICSGGMTCNESNICCSPETDTAFCSRLGKNCGSVTARDNCGVSRTVDCGVCMQWTERTPANSPDSRMGHAMTYDSNRQRVVLFGGEDGNFRDLNDTWEWDGNNWTELTSAKRPPGRSSHSLAYDSYRRRIVLFGGLGGAYLNDIWEWDGNNWTERYPANSPDSRMGHAMTYDSNRQRVVLFGGYVGGNSGSSYLGDIWEWDGNNWTELTPANRPSARGDHKMAYDSNRQRVVLFGGGDRDGAAINDTWEYGP